MDESRKRSLPDSDDISALLSSKRGKACIKISQYVRLYLIFEAIFPSTQLLLEVDYMDRAHQHQLVKIHSLRCYVQIQSWGPLLESVEL